MSFEGAAVQKISGGTVHYGNDENILVEFYMRPVFQEYESKAKGVPVYKDFPFIKMDFPGDRTKSVDTEVDMNVHPFRFPRHWEAFKSQNEQVTVGFPVTEWAAITRSEALELKAMKIHTLEQLVALPDTALTWLGARDLQKRAKTQLEQAKGTAAESSLAAENRALRADLEAMKNQLNELTKTKKKGE